MAELEEMGTVSFVHESNKMLTVRTTLRLVLQENQPVALHGVSVDISQAWEASEPKRRREALMQDMQDGILLVRWEEGEPVVDQINPTGADLLGVDEDICWNTLSAAHPGLCGPLLNPDTKREASSWRHHLGSRDATGAMDVWLSVSCFETADGSIAVQLRDISDEVTDEERMRYDASHDSLTSLLNPRAFRQKFEAGTPDALLGLADERMYEDKRKQKAAEIPERRRSTVTSASS